MLPAGQHVESLYLGDDGLLARVAGKPLLIDCSTIAPETARKVAEAAAAKGLTLLDAPVSGGVGGARAGTLSFIVGGPAEGFARPGRSSRTWAGTSSTPAITAPVGGEDLQQHAPRHPHGRHRRGPGAGGEERPRSGGAVRGDEAEFRRQLGAEPYNPWPGVMPQAPASNGYAGGFQVRLMNKDLGLALANAQAVQASTPLGALARNLFSLHAQADAEHDGLDFSSIQKLYRGKD